MIEVNDLQLERTVDKILRTLEGINEPRVAQWGLAFKAGTDDVRESPAVKIVDALMSRGIEVTAYDPAVKVSPSTGLKLSEDPVDATKDADVLVIATEWPQFGALDLRAVRDAMRGSAVVDARNLLDPLTVEQLGMSYSGVGR